MPRVKLLAPDLMLLDLTAPPLAVPNMGTSSSILETELTSESSFGTSSRDDLHSMSKTLPGPGSYNLKSMFEETGRGTSMTPKRPNSALISASRMPGPGAYNPVVDQKTRSPAYRYRKFQNFSAIM